MKANRKATSKRSSGKLKTGKGAHSSRPAGKESQKTTPPVPENEIERLALLRSLNILDSQPEQAFDDIVTLAASICNTPVALVTLVDENRQWFKANIGLNLGETPREISFCAHAILKPDDVTVVADVRKDPRFKTNPLVTSDPNIRFYAGAPLVTQDGFSLGTLCVIDRKPRRLTPDQLAALRALRNSVITEFELRRSLVERKELQATAGRYKDLRDLIEGALDRVRDGFVAFDPQMNYTYVNERGGELLGRKPEDLIGKNYWNEYPEAKGTPFADAYVRALETQKAIVFEDYYEPFDRWFENRIHPSSDGLSIFFTDITERKRSEQALREQERFISAIADTSPAIVYVYDMETQSNVYTNTGVERILGYSPEEVQAIGSDLFVRLIHPDDLPEVIAFQSKILAATDEGILEIQYRMKHRDGGWRTFHSYERPFLRNKDGSLKQKIGIAIDITDRKRAEDILKASERRFRVLIENGWDAFTLADAQGTILYASPSTVRVLGYTQEEFVGVNALTLFHPDDLAHARDKLMEVLQAPGNVITTQMRTRHKDGSWRWMEGVVTNLFDEPDVQALVTNYRDITERKLVEEALREREELFSTIMEHFPGLISAKDLTGTVIMANPRFELLDERGPAGFIGKNVYDLFPREVADVLWKNDLAVQKAGATIESEETVSHKDGSSHIYLTTKFPLYRSNQMFATCAISTDITERKWTEGLQTAIYQISEAANKASSLDELFQAVHEIIGQVMPTRNFYIALYDDESNLISFPYYVDEVDGFASIPAARPGRGMTEYVIRTGKPLLSDIANFEELARQGEVELVGPPSPIWIGAPLIVEGHTIGVMAMQDYADPNVYTERELRMLEYVSGQVAKAIERTRLYGDIQRHNHILSALQEATLPLISQRELSEVLQAITMQASQLLNSSHSYIYLVEPDEKEVHVVLGTGVFSGNIGFKLRQGEGVAGKVWQTAQPLNVQDYHTWAGRSAHFEDPEFHAVVGVPLISGSQVIGVLALAYLEPERTFSNDDVELLSRFAQLASIAFENARLYTVSRQELAERRMAQDALREAEARYRSLVERLPVVVYTSELGTMGAWDYVSPQIESLLGFTQEEWMADPNLWYQQIHPDDRERQEALEEQSYARGEPFEGEYRIFTRKGREIWIRDSAQILTPREGELPIVQGVLVDITERKRAKEALQESEEIMRLIIDTALDAVITIDQDALITRWNDQAEAIFGWTRTEAVGQRLSKLIIPSDLRARHERGLKHYLETGEGTILDKRIEITAQRRNSDIFPVELTIHVLKANNKVSFAAFVRDITERKQAEQDLRAAETRYRMLVEQLPIIVYVNPANDISSTTYVSPQIKPFLGYTQEEWLEDPKFWSKALHSEDRQRVLGGVELIQQSGKPFDEEYRMVARDGSVVWIRDQATLLRNTDGSPLLWQGLMIDITERKRTEDKIKRHLDHLKALRMIDMTITASADLHLSLQTILRQAVSQLQVDAADILLLNTTTHLLEYSDGIGFLTRGVERSSVRIGEGLAGQAVLERKMVRIHALYESRESLNRKTLLDGENFTDYYGVPLIAKGEVKGVLEVFQRVHIESDQEWEDFLEALAGQAGLAIDNATLFQNLQRSNVELGMAYESTLEGWSAALDLRDKETEGHTLRVTNLTLRLAKHMGLSDKDLMQIRRGALLHDIGKMGVPDRILLKPDNLTTEEWEIMQRHPVYAHELLSRIEYLRPALSIPYCHHEKWNGTGYPRGLKGEEIPLDARVFSVVDVYDALVSDRPYRPAWTKEKALEYIRSLSGVDFDPRVVEGFLELLKQN